MTDPAALLKVLFAFAGLFVPGMMLSRLLRITRLRAAFSFSASVVLLSLTVLVCQAFSIPVTFAACGTLLCIVTTATAFAARGASPAVGDQTPPPLRILVASREGIITTLCCLSFLISQLRAPFLGTDTYFRWQFLAEYLFERRSLADYPPAAFSQFSEYFMPDGIPPTVSIGYWWFYSAFGEVAAPLGGFFVFLQAAVITATVAEISARRWGAAHARWSLAILSLSPELFRLVGLGQESGLLTLAVLLATGAATVGGDERESVIRLALCSVLAALAREYGVAFLAVVILIAWNRKQLRSAGPLIVGAWLAVAGPWYLRNVVRTGNPVNPIDILGLFPTSPLMDRYNDYLTARQGAWSHPLETVRSFVSAFLMPSLPAVVAATVGWRTSAGIERRELAIWVGSLTWLWCMSLSNMSSISVSMRILCALIPILAIYGAPTVAALGERVSERLVSWIVCVGGAVTALSVLAYPGGVSELFSPSMLERFPRGVTAELRARELPSLEIDGSELVLCSTITDCVTLGRFGARVISPYAPELGPVFDDSTSPATAFALLRRFGVTAMAVRTGTYDHDFALERRLDVLSRGLPVIGGTSALSLVRVPG